MDIVVVQGDLGGFGQEIAAAEVCAVIDRGGAMDHMAAGIPCHWRIELASGPAIVVRMAGEEERMFLAGAVGLPLMAGRETVVPIDPLMMVPGSR